MSIVINPYVYAGFTESSNPNTSLYGSGGSWNNAAETSVNLPANTYGYIEREASLDFAGGANLCMVGWSLSTDPVVNSWTGIRWAMYQTGTTAEVRLSGGSTVASTSISIGDILRLERTAGGDMIWKVNGTAFHTISGATTAELKGDLSMGITNDQAKNVVMERGNGPFNPYYINKANVTEY